jgi:hypothetical protein
VLITNGVLFGGTSAYGFRADLRAVYQFYCNNLPRPNEPQYPLWQGLAPGSTLTRDEIGRRLDECTGAGLAKAKRTPQQAQRLTAITGVTGIAAEHLAQHLEWASFTFHDLVMHRLDGLNPFDNTATIYRGSTNDAELNRGVARFAADRRAVDRLAFDSDLTGLIVTPTMTVHYDDDPIVSATADAAYAAKVAAAGKGHLLLQFLADKGTHSRLAEADYLAPLDGLQKWIDNGSRPASAMILKDCRRRAPRADQCTLLE